MAIEEVDVSEIAMNDRVVSRTDPRVSLTVNRITRTTHGWRFAGEVHADDTDWATMEAASFSFPSLATVQRIISE